MNKIIQDIQDFFIRYQDKGFANVFIRQYYKNFIKSYSVKKVFSTLEELQQELDQWINWYNTERTHQGKMCLGRTPMQTFLDAIPLWNEKVANIN